MYEDYKLNQAQINPFELTEKDHKEWQAHLARGMKNMAPSWLNPPVEKIEQRPEIARCLDALDSRVSTLEEGISILEARLAPICKSLPAEDTKPQGEQSAETEVGRRIQAARLRINAATSRIAGLVLTLEV